MLGSTSSSTGISMSCSPTTKHHVFLSFRGEDTRDNFISHLYAEMARKNIETFIDNRLARGDEILPALYKAIEESMIYVVILSENYASSTWCLEELAKILKCRERYGRHVIPVFYKVDPSDVRNQRKSYAEAFVMHQHRFKDDQLDSWKKALTQVAGLSGWDSLVIRPEHKFIEDIVKDILRKLQLNCSFVSDYQGTIGIDKHIEQIQSLGSSAAYSGGATTANPSSKSIYDFTVKDISGNDVSLSQYCGKVLLIVNVASECGLTKSYYKELNILYEKHKNKGFEILAFPCNQGRSQ
ncbi:hypothetical protein TSUD_397160, partial [Trifolium subterraneum]